MIFLIIFFFNHFINCSLDGPNVEYITGLLEIFRTNGITIEPKHKALIAITSKLKSKDIVLSNIYNISDSCYKDVKCFATILLYLGRRNDDDDEKANDTESDKKINHFFKKINDLSEPNTLNSNDFLKASLKIAIERSKSLKETYKIFENDQELQKNHYILAIRERVDIYEVVSDSTLEIGKDYNLKLFDYDVIINLLVGILKEEDKDKISYSLELLDRDDFLFNPTFLNSITNPSKTKKNIKELFDLIMSKKDHESLKEHVKRICLIKGQNMIGICSQLAFYASEKGIRDENLAAWFEYLKEIELIAIGLKESMKDREKHARFIEEFANFYRKNLKILEEFLKSSKADDIDELWNLIKLDSMSKNEGESGDDAISTFWNASKEDQFIKMFVGIFNSKDQKFKEKFHDIIRNSLVDRLSNENLPEFVLPSHEECEKKESLLNPKSQNASFSNSTIDGRILNLIFPPKKSINEKVFFGDWERQVSELVELGFSTSAENLGKLQELYCNQVKIDNKND